MKNRVRINADAEFVYENLLCVGERQVPSRNDVMITLDPFKALIYIPKLRLAKEKLDEAYKAERKYRGLDTDRWNEIFARIEKAQKEYDGALNDPDYAELRHKTFEYFDRYDIPVRIMGTKERRQMREAAELSLDRRSDRDKHIVLVDFYDKTLNADLILFVTKAESDGDFTYWDIADICLKGEYDITQADTDCHLPAMLKPCITEKDNTDWVVDLRLAERKKQIETEIYLYGESRITENLKMVKELLRNYKKNAAILAVANENDFDTIALAKKVALLDKCIGQLSGDDQKLVNDLYVQGSSIGKVAKKYNYAKSTINDRKNRVFDLLELYFSTAIGVKAAKN